PPGLRFGNRHSHCFRQPPRRWFRGSNVVRRHCRFVDSSAESGDRGVSTSLATCRHCTRPPFAYASSARIFSMLDVRRNRDVVSASVSLCDKYLVRAFVESQPTGKVTDLEVVTKFVQECSE